MRFRIEASAFIMGQYIAASIQDPKIVELPDNLSNDHVSQNWTPLDKAAVAALKSLNVTGTVPEEVEPATVAEVKIDPAALDPAPKGKPVTPGG